MMEIDQREIRRYLGYRKEQPDAEVEALIESCTAELLQVTEPKCFYQFYPITWHSEECLSIEGMEITSRNLSKNLKGCSEVCLLGATIGLGTDRLIQRASAIGKMSRTVVYQAAAAAAIEAWCDEVNEEIRKEAAAQGLFTRPRFSPGYGDFSLTHQTEIFRILNLQKKAGITLTESLLMMPTKSVTALIGLSAERTDCILSGCESCGNTDCAYRRC